MNKPTIELFSKDTCAPCKTLKHLLAEAGIEFIVVALETMDSDRLEAVRRNLRTASRNGTPTIPGVCIKAGDTETWISNHGEIDVRPMLAEIQAKLAEVSVPA
jgi:glutaredoxin